MPEIVASVAPYANETQKIISAAVFLMECMCCPFLYSRSRRIPHRPSGKFRTSNNLLNKAVLRDPSNVKEGSVPSESHTKSTKGARQSCGLVAKTDNSGVNPRSS